MGTGSVYQSGGAWWAQWSVGPRSNRRYLRRKRSTEREARAALKELRELGGVRRTKLTVGDYLERWVCDARNIRPATRHAYSVMVTYHLVPALGSLPLANLSPADVERALNRIGQSLGPKSLRNAHGVLRRALNQAVRQDLVARNVASRQFVDAPRVPAVEPRALSADEVRRLLDAARGHRLEALFVTALGTGLRQGELLGLAWEDLSDTLTQGPRGSGGPASPAGLQTRPSVQRMARPPTLTVRYELVRRDGRYLREEPKTPRSRRVVPLAPAVAESLRQHRERVIAAGFTPVSTGPVFTNLRGEPLSGGWLTHRFYRLCQEAKIPRAPFRVLRATFASRLFEAGVPDRKIADMLGHRETFVTHTHYISTAGAEQDQALAAVEALVG